MAESADRRAEKRAQYIARTTELEHRKALALAHCEQGGCERGIADAIGSSKGTVASYLDEIAEKYGSDAILSVGVPEKKDLTPVREQPTKQPTEPLEPCRRVVLNNGTQGPHAVERYYRTWMQDSRIRRDGKIALSLASYDEQVVERLKSLEWEEHHCTYNSDYQFIANTQSPGAWTFDNSTETRAAVIESGVYIPDNLPVVARVVPRREDANPSVCPNTMCEADRAHADKDLSAYPRLSGPGVEIVAKSDVVTHICLSCRSLIVPIPVEVVEDDADEQDARDDIITEVMQA
jgi:hypothetical protein